MMTPQLLEVFSFIVAYQQKHGTVPTVRQLANMQGRAGFSSTHRILKVLEARGFVEGWWNKGYKHYVPTPQKPVYFAWDDATKSLRPLPGFHGATRLRQIEIPLEVEPKLRPLAEVRPEQDGGLGGHAPTLPDDLVDAGRGQLQGLGKATD
jgi:SOS-response transcriptional repressor LexA